MPLNFNTLPTEKPAGGVKPGRHELTIADVTRGPSKTGSDMLTIKCAVNGFENFNVTDYAVMYDAQGNEVKFGQYKLAQYFRATDSIPTGDFDLSIVPALLKGKKFSANLIEEEYNGKMYIKMGDSEDFLSIGMANNPASVSPQSFMQQEQPQMTQNQQGAVDAEFNPNDDDLPF